MLEPLASKEDFVVSCGGDTEQDRTPAEPPSPGAESGSLAWGAGSSPLSLGRVGTRRGRGEGGAGLGCHRSLQGLRFAVAGKEMMSLFGVAGACF